MEMSVYLSEILLDTLICQPTKQGDDRNRIRPDERCWQCLPYPLSVCQLARASVVHQQSSPSPSSKKRLSDLPLTFFIYIRSDGQTGVLTAR